MYTSSKAVRFTVNFVERTIVGTKASFDKAGKGFGDIYEELVGLMERHPDYRLEVKEQKKHSAKPKETYDGLTIDLMVEYISIQENATELKEEFDRVCEFGKAKGSKYPMAKRWFVEKFDKISVKKINNALFKDAKAA